MKNTAIIFAILCIFVSCHRNVYKLTDAQPAVFSTSPISNNVQTMQLDGHGYLWIGTDRGVNVYDGENYRLLQHENGDTTTLRSNSVVSLYKSPTDSMWVMTDDGIDLYQGNGVFRHYYTDASIHAAGSVVETQDGRIIALYGGELCLLKDGMFRKVCKLVDRYVGSTEVSIIESGDGRFVVNTRQGVFVVDKDLRHYKQLPFEGIANVCVDKNTICVLGFTDGIALLNRKDLSVKYCLRQGMPTVAEGAVMWKGNVIFFGYEGIYSFDCMTHQIKPLPQDIQKDVKPEFIQKLYVDNNEMLWIGYNSGYSVKKTKDIASAERTLRQDSIYNVFRQHGVVSVTQDNKGNIFGALVNDSIFLIDEATGGMTLKGISELVPVHSRQHVSSVAYSAGYYWIVTTANVIAMHYDNGFKVDEFYDAGLATNSVCGTSVPIDNGLAVLLGNNSVVTFDAIHKSQEVNDTRQAANQKPVLWRLGDFTIKNITLKGSLIPIGSHLVSIGDSKLLATFQHKQPSIINLKTGKVSNATFKFDANVISSTTSSNHAYLGTDNGLYIYDNNSNRLSKVDEIGNKPVNNIVATESGIVMTCEGDILTFDPATRHINKIWVSSPKSDFQPHTLAMANSKKFYGATRMGFKSYDVLTKTNGEPRPTLYIEGVDAVMGNNSHKSCKLFESEKNARVVLTHTENTIKIKYAAITPSMDGKYTFRYRLKGYDGNWQQNDGSGEVEYAKIRPGTYLFDITCTDQQRPWITVSKSLKIVVKSHPLLSHTAISIYILLALTIAFFANRLYIRMRMVRIKADNVAKEKDRERQVNRMNMSFFANISHEFRNPITMISGPVSVLLKAPELSKQSNSMVRLISQSARILMKLVNQMLDFNLLEGEAMRLSVNRIDVAAIIKEYSHHYEVSASEKGIHIINISTDKPVVMLADEDKIIKVFDNLMSNALKHTPQGGDIKVVMAVDNDKLNFSVENSGVHIPDASLGRIFDRYYQATNDVADWGTGLGLHYVKSLVTLHHGEITASNTENGVRFTVEIPMNDDAYSEEERKPREQQGEDALANDEILRPKQLNDDGWPAQGTATTPGEMRRLLIVEKDVNTAYFLRKLFENDYTVVNRYDAETTLDDIDNIKPDIIISCIMLEGKSGLELCKVIKENEDYAHTPFIFLTTCNSGGQQADGMRAGADVYITKPFDPEYLKEVVSNALVKADDYKQLLQRLPQPQKEDKGDGLSTRDKEILRTIRKFMKDNIDDGELNVEKLSRKLLLSRTKLYEKIKELTGKTPNELFRTYKLNYAAQLLKEGKLNVSEVAEKAGFSSVAFFSRTFKKYFGVSPKDYD